MDLGPQHAVRLLGARSSKWQAFFSMRGGGHRDSEGKLENQGGGEAQGDQTKRTLKIQGCPGHLLRQLCLPLSAC